MPKEFVKRAPARPKPEPTANKVKYVAALKPKPEWALDGTSPSYGAVELPDIWERWEITIRMKDKLMGSMPKNPGDVEKFSAAAMKGAPDPEAAAEALTEKLMEEVPVDKLAEIGSATFKSDPKHGIYIESRQVKAAFKEAANMLGFTQRDNPGRQFFQHAFFIEPDRMYLGRQIDGTERLFGTVQTPSGERSIVRNVDYVTGVEISFLVKALAVAKPEKVDVPRTRGKGTKPQTVHNLAKRESRITDEQIRMCLALIQDNGLGACRSQAYGKCVVIRIKKL